MNWPVLHPHSLLLRLLLAAILAHAPGIPAQESPRIDYLSLARGAIPLAIDDRANDLRVGTDQALQAIDGDPGGFLLTPKPGGAESRITLSYKLPALTVFSEFAVPNVLETPSPSQTFVRLVEISGAAEGSEGPFQVLATGALTTHPQKGEVTAIPATSQVPVRWLRVVLAGGINVLQDKTFFEFSELIGFGSQEPVPLSEAFEGKWKGRGLVLELQQEGVVVTGCYDGEGDLNGIVSGNLLRATGENRKSGVPSAFVLALADDGEIVGVRSTNRAPFRLYGADPEPGITTECSAREVQQPGCGAIIHGISFEFDSATIQPESDGVLEALASGLKASTPAGITVIGHTSSEGSEAYNDDLSQRRAEAVVAALIDRGIAADQLAAQGRGERQPIADNTTEAGRSMNRRVEISCH